MHGAAHADTGTGGLEEGDDGICYVYGSKPGVADAVPDEKSVYYGVDAGQGERQQGGDHIAEKFLTESHPQPPCPS